MIQFDKKPKLGFLKLFIVFTTDNEAEPEVEAIMVMCLRLRRLSTIETLPRPMKFGPSDKVILGDELSSFKSAFNGIKYATYNRFNNQSKTSNFQKRKLGFCFELPESEPLRKTSV